MKNLYDEMPNGYPDSIQKRLAAVRCFSSTVLQLFIISPISHNLYNLFYRFSFKEVSDF